MIISAFLATPIRRLWRRNWPRLQESRPRPGKRDLRQQSWPSKPMKPLLKTNGSCCKATGLKFETFSEFFRPTNKGTMRFTETVPSLRTISTLAALLCCGFSLEAADGPTRYLAQPSGSLVRIQGTSTAHDWEMKGTIIGGVVEFAEGVKIDCAQAEVQGVKSGKVPVKVHAIIPVRSVHS